MFNSLPIIPVSIPTPSCTQVNGIQLCRIIREAFVDVGIFPALTGGLLYKDGERKDIDIVLYRHRQKIDSFEVVDFVKELGELGIEITGFYGFVTKAKWNGMTVDIFNPETASNLNTVY